ncbi:MAG: HAMP domain-containing histidine kinase [Desulfobulbaceae bacterium]|nr:HAMP domain-containing histidine kinase [Desulfobulbaceae bacterium]
MMFISSINPTFRINTKDMPISIFTRLIISYLALFGILAGANIYFVYHIDQFNKVIRSIVINDTMVLEYSNQLSDALLSESRNDRKYVVLKDQALYDSSLEASDEFNQLLNEVLIKTNFVELKQLFSAISSEHQDFTRLVIREHELIMSAEPYSAAWYSEEKKRIADKIIVQLKKIRQTSEKIALNEIVDLNESGVKAKKISILILFFGLSSGLIVAFVITRSIKKPLDVMRTKTIEIAQGNFKGDLKVDSPPEIVELAGALNIMCRKLQEVDDIKSDFFSSMSHELRTPLTSIKVGTEMLLEGLGGQLSEKQLHILSIVARESDRLIAQVNALLDLSKMEAGMMEYNFIPTELSVLVKKTLDDLSPLVEEKKISLENSIGTLIPVHVDPERILQVLRNILGNAIKFSHTNGIIKVEAHLRGNLVEVAVHDTGPGIPEGDLEKIFLKFQQVISSTGQRIKGTGIGLATVKQVILAHGGKVWATSQVEKGSTLHITLPLAV